MVCATGDILREILAADLLCGAGGFSEGCRRAMVERGVRLQMTAVNHWDIAIATHEKNQPLARAFRMDMYRTNPGDLVPGRRLDMVMASPTCTFNSRARGGRPISRDQGVPFLAPYYGTGRAGSIEGPFPTATTKDRHALVMPVTHRDESGRARSADETLPTVTGAQRGELAFITAQFGERPGQDPRVHDLGLPVPTITATGHVNLVLAKIGDALVFFDTHLRMIQPEDDPVAQLKRMEKSAGILAALGVLKPSTPRGADPDHPTTKETKPMATAAPPEARPCGCAPFGKHKKTCAEKAPAAPAEKPPAKKTKAAPKPKKRRAPEPSRNEGANPALEVLLEGFDGAVEAFREALAGADPRGSLAERAARVSSFAAGIAQLAGGRA